MSTQSNVHLRVMSWNVGFGSRKGFSHDLNRAEGILKIVKDFKVDVLALQEMGNSKYNIGLPSFNFIKYMKENDDQLNSFDFLPTVSLGSRHCYPYGKLPQMNRESGVSWFEYGPGVWVRNVNNLHLRNLYSDDNKYPATIEVQRPIPHPLYMGEKPEASAGRDEEDRPALWARIDTSKDKLQNLKIYFVSMHLPTLKNEEKNIRKEHFTSSQENIAQNMLKLSKKWIDNNSVDQLGSELRQYYLKQVTYQAKKIEEFWKAENSPNRCVFILAGDFNFYHNKNNKLPEQKLLEDYGFICAKIDGTTRPIDEKHPNARLIDNVWVKGAKDVMEYRVNGNQIEKSTYVDFLTKISDHYPVIADINFEVT